MSPGLPIEKHVLSSYQLRSHSDLIHSWPPEALMAAILQPEGFMSCLENPITGDRETIVDLVAFGSCQVYQNKLLLISNIIISKREMGALFCFKSHMTMLISHEGRI